MYDTVALKYQVYQRCQLLLLQCIDLRSKKTPSTVQEPNLYLICYSDSHAELAAAVPACAHGICLNPTGNCFNKDSSHVCWHTLQQGPHIQQGLTFWYLRVSAVWKRLYLACRL